MGTGATGSTGIGGTGTTGNMGTGTGLGTRNYANAHMGNQGTGTTLNGTDVLSTGNNSGNKVWRRAYKPNRPVTR